ncbi:MAG TPA: DinB family protein, partial [Ferruginibacter sp.]|nr:DinB family protein [Ferruginibacter sp.]
YQIIKLFVMSKPSTETYPVYFQRYVDQVPEEDLGAAFKNQLPVIKEFLASITEEKSFYAYDEGKWTLKELLQHMIDTERIFNYRALCFARLEKASLPSFEEDDYAANSNANSRSWQEMLDEFFAVRHATELLFKSFSPGMLHHSGISNNKPGTVLSIGFTLVGHVYHHKKIMEERYLSAEKISN